MRAPSTTHASHVLAKPREGPAQHLLQGQVAGAIVLAQPLLDRRVHRPAAGLALRSEFGVEEGIGFMAWTEVYGLIQGPGARRDAGVLGPEAPCKGLLGPAETLGEAG